MRTWFVSLLKKINGPAEHQLPRKRKHRRTRIPTPTLPYSVLLPERFSGSAALHLRYPSPGFSRATSIHSPYPLSGRLRVSLLRQACAVPLRTSFAVIELCYYHTTALTGCQLRFYTNCPCTSDAYSQYMDNLAVCVCKKPRLLCRRGRKHAAQ